MRIAISAGGTGGGVYPALSAAAALRRLVPDGLTLVFVGARGDKVAGLVPNSPVTFDAHHQVLAGPLHGVGRGQQVVSAVKLILGTLQAVILALRLRPEALLITGGWTGVPMALACWLLRIPVVIYVPDIEPGLVLKLMGRRFARVIAATVPETGAYYPGRRVVATGYPLRAALAVVERGAALARFGLDPARQTLLIFGGSRGARTINTAAAQVIPALLAQGIQVLHISGTADWETVQAQHAALPPEQQAAYRVFEYLHDIGHAFAAADLVISRAGASTLGEYPLFGLPAILVPYPFAWRYQKINADWLVERGAALRLEDEKMGDELLPAVLGLLGDPARLAAMRAAAESLRRADGAENLARLLAEVAGHPLVSQRRF